MSLEGGGGIPASKNNAGDKGSVGNPHQPTSLAGSTFQSANTAVAAAAAVSTAAAVAAATQSFQNAMAHQLHPSLPLPQQYPPAAVLQHLQSMIPSLTPAPVLPVMPLSGTQFFQNMKLRRGKWTPEEEQYANLLIEEFENGTVTDCENGCTLRAFLSRKLHCAPMRISKKFAGKSIGKHVFLSRSTGSGLNHVRNHGSDSGGKLRELEHKFYHSLLHESGVSDSGHVQPMMPPNSSNPYQPPAAFNPQTPLPSNPFFQPLLYSSPALVAPYNGHNNGVALGHSLPVHAPNAANLQTPCFVPNPPAGTNPSNQISATGETDNSKQLHQKQLNVVQEIAVNSDKDENVGKSPHQENHSGSTANSDGCLGGDKKGSCSSHVVESGVSLAQSASEKAAINGGEVGQGGPNDKDGSTLPATAVPVAAVPGAVSKCVSTEIHDLLSGFDNVAAMYASSLPRQQLSWPSDNTALAPSSDAAPTHFSPPLTSKSFDELHQYLGNETIPSLPQQVNSKGTAIEENSLKGPATAALQLETASTTVVGEMKPPKAQSNSNDPTRGMPHPNLNPLVNGMGSCALVPKENVDCKVESTQPVKKDPVSAPAPVTADAYAMFAQQSALAVSQHSAYCRNGVFGSSPASEARTRPRHERRHNRSQQPHNTPMVVDDESSASSRRADGSAVSSSFVNAANLKAHAKAAEAKARAADESSSSDSSTQMMHRSQKRARACSASGAAPQTFTMGVDRHSNIVSASEREFNSDMGTESESALGSSRGSSTGSGSESIAGSDNTSDNASDNSDSGSDEGQTRVPSTCRENAKTSTTGTGLCHGGGQTCRKRERDLISCVSGGDRTQSGCQWS